MTSTTNVISIKVEVSSRGGNKIVEVNNISSSTTVGELKTKLNVQPNSRLGRLEKFENWDNQRSLDDYFLKNGEQLSCVIQCAIQEGQPSFDDYDEWLSANKN